MESNDCEFFFLQVEPQSRTRVTPGDMDATSMQFATLVRETGSHASVLQDSQARGARATVSLPIYLFIY